MLLLLLAVPGFAKPDAVPDWVRTAAARTLPHYSAETNAVVLLDETRYVVANDGRATEHYRRVVKILRPQGRGESRVGVNFDNDTKLLSFHVWAIGPDGHEYAMKDKEFSDVGYGGGGIAFEDVRFRLALAPGGDPGGIVAYEYEQRMRPFAAEKTWRMQENIPRLSQSFTLELPPGYTFGAVWAHHAALKAIDLESQRWRWDVDDTPGIDLERVVMAPAAESLLGRMTIHYSANGAAKPIAATWRNVGEWYEPLARDRLIATPEIAARSSMLIGDHTDFVDKAEAIAEFVQKQVRYFAIEVGIGGYQPHAAGDVLRNLYGDCKDKATLVSAMLSSVGIHAALLMVDTERGVVDPDAPSMVGNHMISAIEIPKGYTSPRLRSVVTAATGRRYVIFDPTWDKTPFGQLESNLQGSYGVLMEGSDTEAVLLPVLDPTFNTIRRTAIFHLDPSGGLKGSVTEKRFGDVSEQRRTMYISGDVKERREYLDHMLERDLTSFTASDVKVENADSLNKDFTLSYTLSADKYARSMGPLLMVRPRVLGSLGLKIDREQRLVPFDLGETMQAHDEYDIELPAGYAIDEMPDPVNFDIGFAAYQSASVVKGSTIHYTRTYTVRQVTLPAARYEDVLKLAGVIEADEQSRVVLKKL